MKVVILYRPNSEHARKVEEFAHMFRRFHPGKKLELVDLGTEEGANIQKLYDVTVMPAILALRDDSSMLNMWQGEELPLMNEVAAYT